MTTRGKSSKQPFPAGRFITMFAAATTATAPPVSLLFLTQWLNHPGIYTAAAILFVPTALAWATAYLALAYWLLRNPARALLRAARGRRLRTNSLV